MPETEEARNSDDLVDIGEQHHKAGRLQQAESYYRRALEIDPGHPGALYYLANLTYSDGRLPLAAQLLDTLLRDEPNDAEAWHLRGMIALKEGNFARAIEHLNEALATQPAYMQAHYSLGDAFNAQGDFETALAHFQRVLMLNPAVAEAHCSIGNILQAQRKFDEALSSYREAIRLKSDFVLAYENIGAILLSQDQWDEAINIFRKAIAENASDARIHAGLGKALLAVHQYAAAATSYEQALALQPYFPEAYYHCGNALQALKRCDEAAVCFEKALALKPDYCEAHDRRDEVLRELKRSDETPSTLITHAPSLHKAGRKLNPVRPYKNPIPPGAEAYYTDYQYAPSRYEDVDVITIDGRDVRVLDRISEPEIVIFDNILSAAECELLIELSRPRLQRSATFDPNRAGARLIIEGRTSEGASFWRGENELIRTIESRLATLMNLPCEHGEGLQVLHYQTGAEYIPHYDFASPEDASSSAQLQKAGQRVATLVMYLNDVESGGETIFPEIEFAVTPRKGSGVYFSYCDAAGKCDRLTLHGGAPVKRGEKWIATKWVKQRAWEVGR